MLHLKDGNYIKRNNESHAHSNWQPLPPFLSFLPSKLACRQAGQFFVLYSSKLVLYMIEGGTYIVSLNTEILMPKSHIAHFLLFLQVLIKLIKPYTRIKIGFISGELNIEPSDVESLLVSCILDTTIYGRIDQVRAHFKG